MSVDVILFNLVCFDVCTGWGPHIYFQMLAESSNDTQTGSVNGLNVAPLEIENVRMHSRGGMGIGVSDDNSLNEI